MIEIDNNKTYKKNIYWRCQCQCGNEVSVSRSCLTSGHTKSCGCLQKEAAKELQLMKSKSNNNFILHNNYYECVLSNGVSTIFDLNDIDIIKNYGWYMNAGYAYTVFNDKCVPMHYILFKDYLYDHKNHDKLDNRRENLRKCNYFNNNQNHTIRKDNTSGISGVNYHKSGRWISRININGKRITIYSGDSFEDAVRKRLEAEKKYYGEFAPQKDLYKQYGIEQ